MKQDKLISLFGNPMETTDRVNFERNFMVIWDVPSDIKRMIPALPYKIYLHKQVKEPLEKVLRILINKGLHIEIKTYDGCFNPRYQRGSKKAISIHSWGGAFDFNAKLNPLKLDVTIANRPALRKAYVRWSEPFLQVWRDNGFECGADWQSRLDGMHFEYKF